MTIQRITISVPNRIARRIRKAAAHKSVSAWVTSVIEDHLAEAELDRRWKEFYREVAPSRENVRAADAPFKRLTGRTRRRASSRASA
jgi:hypothetical protein